MFTEGLKYAPPEAEKEQHPWADRVAKVREKENENLAKIVRKIGNGVDFSSEAAKEEISHTQETFGVSINTSSGKIPGLLKEGRYISREEFASRFEKLFDSELRKRRALEKSLGVRPNCSKSDPPLIYGAAISDCNRDKTVGGAKFYGGTIIILKNENIRDRVTFCYGDSFYLHTDYDEQNANTEVVTWSQAPVLKYIREQKGDSSEFVEAHIAGGVNLDDIEEIRLPTEDEYDDIVNDPEVQRVLVTHPDLKIVIRGENDSLKVT